MRESECPSLTEECVGERCAKAGPWCCVLSEQESDTGNALGQRSANDKYGNDILFVVVLDYDACLNGAPQGGRRDRTV